MSLPLPSRPVATGSAPDARRRSLWIDETAAGSALGLAPDGGPGLLDTFVQGFLRGSMLCLAVCTPSRSMPLRRRTPVRIYKMRSVEAALPRRVAVSPGLEPAAPREAPASVTDDPGRPLVEEPELVEV